MKKNWFQRTFSYDGVAAVICLASIVFYMGKQAVQVETLSKDVEKHGVRLSEVESTTAKLDTRTAVLESSKERSKAQGSLTPPRQLNN